MADSVGPDPGFLAAVDQWVGVLGRLRDMVRQHVVATQLADVLSKRDLRAVRVLDVGCGQGTQALLLARSGQPDCSMSSSATAY